MIEMIWRLPPGPLASESQARPLLEALVAMPGFDPGSYDLNQRQQPRAFDLDHAVVDTLTQRTQCLWVGGRAGSMAFLTCGKHGEAPAMAVRLAEPWTSAERDAWWGEARSWLDRLEDCIWWLRELSPQGQASTPQGLPTSLAVPTAQAHAHPRARQACAAAARFEDPREHHLLWHFTPEHAPTGDRQEPAIGELPQSLRGEDVLQQCAELASAWWTLPTP